MSNARAILLFVPPARRFSTESGDNSRRPRFQEVQRRRRCDCTNHFTHFTEKKTFLILDDNKDKKKSILYQNSVLPVQNLEAGHLPPPPPPSLPDASYGPAVQEDFTLSVVCNNLSLGLGSLLLHFSLFFLVPKLKSITLLIRTRKKIQIFRSDINAIPSCTHSEIPVSRSRSTMTTHCIKTNSCQVQKSEYCIVQTGIFPLGEG